MNPKYRRYIKKYYKFKIDKGEIAAGNNSRVLKEELKKIISELNNFRI